MEELRIHYMMNKNNLSIYNESVATLSNHVNIVRHKMKNPQSDASKLYQEYVTGGNKNPSGQEDLR